MTTISRPRFEVVVGATAAERRLVSATTIRALSGIASTVDDAALNLLIDAALAQCARSCRMATYRALPPTLAQESVRATWTQDVWEHTAPPIRRPSFLVLPWRAPIRTITITEGGVELVENTDYQLLGSGLVERMNGGWWPTSGTIVVDYQAGFALSSDDPSYEYDTGEPLPADIVALLADQVRLADDRSIIDLNLRSEDVPGLWSGTFNVPGGDAIDTGGLLRPLYDALTPYRSPVSFA